MNKYDVIIVGSGIAGMMSAIYLKRAGAKVVVLEKNAPGGQLNKAEKIKNFPGFAQIDGPTLANNIFMQMRNLDILYQYGNALKITQENGEFKVITDMGDLEAQCVILALGRIPRKLELENEDRLIGKGISYCGLCDGYLYKDETVIVVGGGNSALSDALYLSAICKKVILIHRRDKFTADDIIINEVLKRKNIKIMYESRILNYLMVDDALNEVEVLSDHKKVKLKVKGVFVAVGYEPNIKLLDELKIKTINNYIVVDENMKTSIDGLYACGDIINKKVYQLTTAIGEAAIAADSVSKLLRYL